MGPAQFVTQCVIIWERLIELAQVAEIRGIEAPAKLRGEPGGEFGQKSASVGRPAGATLFKLHNVPAHQPASANLYHVILEFLLRSAGFQVAQQVAGDVPDEVGESVRLDLVQEKWGMQFRLESSSGPLKIRPGNRVGTVSYRRRKEGQTMAEDRGQKTEDRPGTAGGLAAGMAGLRPGFTGRGIGLGITAAVLASLLIGLLWVRGRRPPPPVYQGRSLSEWLARIDSGWTTSHPDRSSPDWLQASNAIAQIGLDGVPWYLEWIRYQPSRALEALERIPIPDSLADFLARSGGWHRSFASYDALEILGPRLAPHIPELTRLATSGSGNAPELAAQVLIGVGPEAWPQVLNLATNGSFPGSQSALRSIGRLGEAARPAIPTLIWQLQGGGLLDPRTAAYCLGKLRLEPELCVPVLRQALSSGSPELQRAAAFALGEFGSAARSALPDLERLRTDRDRYLASSASNAVQAILASQDSREDRTGPDP